MPSSEKILLEMDRLLSDLIETAERLQNISQQVISKEELAALQASQAKLVEHLVKLDAAFKSVEKGDLSEKTKKLRSDMEKKLEKFEQLNAHFIENVTGTQSLLKFGETKKAEE